MSDTPPSLPPLAWPAAAADWAIAAGRLSLTLETPAWPPMQAEMAAAPLVVIGHDYVAPPRAVPAAPPAITREDPPEDPFARLLTGLHGQRDNIWPG